MLARCSRHGVKLGCAIAALIALTAISTGAQQSKASAPASPALSYIDMVREVKAGDLSVDFAQMRMAYAATPEYAPDGGADDTQQMFALLNAKKFDDALKIANKVLEKQYVNIDAHLVASASYDGLQKASEAKLHHDIVVGLVKSILNSGSGDSTATAYKVISVEEEYSVMRVMGWRPGKQSLIHEGPRSFDLMEMTDTRDGSTVTRYFDVTLSEQQMTKALGR
jgi:Domain of unknown function (DUF4919)